jgi:hypothetical protein
VKYFTPDLYARGQSDDDDILDGADQLWEEAGERYAAYLRSIEPELPPGIRNIHENYYLHDAVVLSVGRQGDTFVIVLQLDTPSYDAHSDLLLFTYELAGEPIIDREALPGEHRCEQPVEWMYDEVELVPGQPATCVQSVLLSNGWEVRLPMRDVRIQPLQSLIPGSRDRPAALPHVALT